MKKGYIKIACWALLTAGLGGCATDDALKEGGHDNGLTDVGTNYLAFNIVSDAGTGTRAWLDDDTNFDAGDEAGAEQAITTVQGSNVVLLFNGEKFHSMVNLNANNAVQGETEDRYGKGLEKTIGKFTANIKAANEETDLPTKLLVVLNGNPERLAQLEIDLKAAKDLYLYDDASKKTLKPDEYALAYLTRRLSDESISANNSSIVIFSPSNDDTEYCTMSNAVYVGYGTLEGENNDTKVGDTGKVYNWTYITPNNIKTTEEEAAAEPLTVHVERLAVKVELALKEELGEQLGATDRAGFKYPVLITPADNSKVAQIVPDGAGGKKTEQTEWAFSMLGWSTNAVARRMYLFKNLDDERVDISGTNDLSKHYDGTKNEITSAFFSGWNDARHARCYWAVDGHYAEPTAYPVQYRVAKDNTATQSYVELTNDGVGTANMPLYYYSFQQLRMIAMGLVPNADPTGMTEGNYEAQLQNGSLRKNLAYRYCGENVLGQALLKAEGDIWRGASTHAIIFGQLLIGGEENGEINTYKKDVNGKQFTQDMLNSVSDKLYAAGSYWNRADYMEYAFTMIYRALNDTSRDVTDYFGGTGEIVTPRKAFKLFYKNADGTGKEIEIPSDYFTNLSGLNDIHDNFDYTKDDCNGDDDDESECIFRLSAANVSNGDGKVMLGLKKAYKLIIKGKNETDTGESTFDDLEITPEKFLSLAYNIVGPADYFARGRMYYYVPIYHVATASAKTGADPKNVGDIGVVRNHWYKLKISSLLKPGIPVSDPNQPIIPNIDPSDRYLGLDVHILPWYVVNQEITLQ